VDVKTKNLADLYGMDPIPWSRAREALENGDPLPHGTTFLATTRPDGRPHIAGVGAMWDDGKVYIVSGPETRKSRNLAENPSCAIAMCFDGMDLVIEGTIERVTDDATLQRLAKRYAEGRGWRLHVRVQRPERRTPALVPLRHDPDPDVRRGQR
jgi:pyridoxine/pyridoxamine 5'-phosphate oxidase